MPLTSPGNDDDTGENHQPTLRKNTAEPVEQTLKQNKQRLLAMLEEKLPEGADPILHSDMGWQYQHDWWRNRLGELGIRQSMSRKGNCIDNAATEQVFGHLKDEFYTGREFASYEEFKSELDAYIIHWNTRRRQIRLEGHTPEEFRNMSLTA